MDQWENQMGSLSLIRNVLRRVRQADIPDAWLLRAAQQQSDAKMADSRLRTFGTC